MKVFSLHNTVFVAQNWVIIMITVRGKRGEEVGGWGGGKDGGERVRGWVRPPLYYGTLIYYCTFAYLKLSLCRSSSCKWPSRKRSLVTYMLAQPLFNLHLLWNNAVTIQSALKCYCTIAEILKFMLNFSGDLIYDFQWSLREEKKISVPGKKAL